MNETMTCSYKIQIWIKGSVIDNQKQKYYSMLHIHLLDSFLTDHSLHTRFALWLVLLPFTASIPPSSSSHSVHERQRDRTSTLPVRKPLLPYLHGRCRLSLVSSLEKESMGLNNSLMIPSLSTTKSKLFVFFFSSICPELSAACSTWLNQSTGTSSGITHG